MASIHSVKASTLVLYAMSPNSPVAVVPAEVIDAT
jgi:hypothetical protein